MTMVKSKKTTKSKNKRKINGNLFNELKNICASYGVDLVIDEFFFEIKFKDGRSVIYPIPPFNEFNVAYLAKAKGRVFSKEGKYIGTVPSSSSLDAIIVNADMMV